MKSRGKSKFYIAIHLTLIASLLLGSGCTTLPCHQQPEVDLPRELEKVSFPPYTLEPPDILLIDALRLLPLPPYKIEPLDALSIVVPNTLTEPIAGVYQVQLEGTLNLGATYGSVQVDGMTIEQAKQAIEKTLKKVIKEPQVQVALAQSRASQQIRGEHLIRPDGTVGLGGYGSVYVAGMTLEEAKQAIEAHLSKYLLRPEVSLDVYAYNSKTYYVITDGAGFGEQVYRFPTTGNETVLDAVSQINGLPAVASRKRIYLVRPAPKDCPNQIFPIDWKGITRGGSTGTNYQILPGDRLYVEAEPVITTDTYLARIISPFERMLGITLLSSSTIRSIKIIGAPLNSSGTGGGAGNTGFGGF